MGSSANIRVWRDVEFHAVAVWKISQKTLDQKKIIYICNDYSTDKDMKTRNHILFFLRFGLFWLGKNRYILKTSRLYVRVPQLGGK